MLVFKYKSLAKIYNYILVSSTVKKHFANIGLFSPYIRRAKKKYAYARYIESQKEIHLTLIYGDDFIRPSIFYCGISPFE